MPENDNLSKAAIDMILDCIRRRAEADSKRYAKEGQIRQSAEQIIKNDEEILSWKEQEDAWRKASEEGVKELFPPGTLIESSDGIDTTRYYVVDEPCRVWLDVYQVTSPPSRKRHTTRIHIDYRLRIIFPQEIADKQLRKNAEALIAKVRLKDW